MSPQSLKDLLAAYPPRFAPNRWEEIGSGRGFSGALIYRLETDAGPFCLRGWPANSLPAERILGLHRLLGHVFERGVEVVSVPVASQHGKTLVTMNNQAWQLEPWMPGRADFWENPSRDRLSAAMACLAKFHQATEGYEDIGPARKWFYQRDQAVSPAVTERLALLREWRQSKIEILKERGPSAKDFELIAAGVETVHIFESIAGFIEQQLEVLSRVRFRLQPCLRDVWHDHVLFSGDEVTGLIDPSACRSENIATDLARLLGSLVADDRDAWVFAIGEYEKHRPLTSDERALVQALDQSGVLLSALNWLDRLILKKETVENWPRVLDRLKILRQRLKTLAETLGGTQWYFKL